MSKLDESALKTLRSEINAALDSVASKNGVTLQLGSCTFDRANGNFTFALEGTVEGGLNKEEANYERLREFRPKLPPRHSTFVIDDKSYQIIGANSTLTGIIAAFGGKHYSVSISVVEDGPQSDPNSIFELLKEDSYVAVTIHGRQYGVWCTRYGGPCGPAEAWLKDDGKVIVFESLEAASKEAARIQRDTRSANLRYEPRELRPDDPNWEKHG